VRSLAPGNVDPPLRAGLDSPDTLGDGRPASANQAGAVAEAEAEAEAEAVAEAVAVAGPDAVNTHALPSLPPTALPSSTIGGPLHVGAAEEVIRHVDDASVGLRVIGAIIDAVLSGVEEGARALRILAVTVAGRRALPVLWCGCRLLAA
jgi:hypothetical protein